MSFMYDSFTRLTVGSDCRICINSMLQLISVLRNLLPQPQVLIGPCAAGLTPSEVTTGTSIFPQSQLNRSYQSGVAALKLVAGLFKAKLDHI